MLTDHFRGYPENGWTQITWQEYWELKRKAIEYDRRTNQPDCAKPDLLEWETRIEDILRKKGILKP